MSAGTTMDTKRTSDNERWLLSLYRNSEIEGALFFGRLSRSVRDPRIQADMTRHFADESMHAHYWTQTLSELGTSPVRIHSKYQNGYQERYLEAGGLPTNLMEVLAVTLAFERRVARHYTMHRKVRGIDRVVVATFERIMKDEGWHIRWLTDALERMKAEYGNEKVAATVQRYVKADAEVYEKVTVEHAERLQVLARTA
jgi:bacterioferritin (cytochrome b1)